MKFDLVFLEFCLNHLLYYYFFISTSDPPEAKSFASNMTVDDVIFFNVFSFSCLSWGSVSPANVAIKLTKL